MVAATRHKVTEFTLLGLALFAPLVSIGIHRAIVPICAIAALILFYSIGPKLIWSQLRNANRFLVGTTVLFVMLLVLSTLWAPDPVRGIVTVGKISGSVLFGTILIMVAKAIAPETAQRVILVFVCSISAVGAFIAIDAATSGALSITLLGKSVGKHYGHFWLKPAAAVIAIGIWPLSLYLWRTGKSWIAVFTILVAAASAYAIGANGVAVTIIGGACIALMFCVLGRLRSLVGIGAFAIFCCVILFQPMIIKQFVSPQAVGAELTLNKPIAGSTLYRLYIWDFVSERILEKPILGWGVGASRHIGNEIIIVDPKWGEIGEAVPLHPHNSFLQLYLELGVFGLILSLVPIWLIIRRLSTPEMTFAERFAGTGLLFSVLFQYSISFSVWSSWWNAAVILSVTMMIVAWRSETPNQSGA